jgi:hypothetical protein
MTPLKMFACLGGYQEQFELLMFLYNPDGCKAATFVGADGDCALRWAQKTPARTEKLRIAQNVSPNRNSNTIMK